MVNNLTSLPKFWYVRRNKENASILNKWNNDTYARGAQDAWAESSTVGMCSDKDYCVIEDIDKTRYTEITFEQFEMWILNKQIIVELW
jgi:hypothetical protein